RGLEAQYHDSVYRLTITDGLTQVFNRRYLVGFVEREMARCSRHGRPLSLLILDVDHFKAVNDTHGHLAGDFVLRELASLLRPRIRREGASRDTAARSSAFCQRPDGTLQFTAPTISAARAPSTSSTSPACASPS